MLKLSSTLLTLAMAVSMVLPCAAGPAAGTMTAVKVAGSSPLYSETLSYREVAYGQRASKLIGATVYNDQNQAIGKIADLIVDPKDYVSIVIVSVGGFLGIGAKDVAVSARFFTTRNNRITLAQATKQALEQLPPFHFAH